MDHTRCLQDPGELQLRDGELLGGDNSAGKHTLLTHTSHTRSSHTHTALCRCFLFFFFFFSRALLGESPAGTLQGSKKQTMLSFKQFLAQQDDSIDETDAIQKYNEYKREFKQKQIMEFFDEHKEEDW